MEVTVRGLDELKAGLSADLARLEGREVKRAMRVGVYAGAAKARDLVRARAPVDTGFLRKSVKARSRRARGGALAVAGVYVEPSAYHWRFLEYGTVNMRPHPFIRPAFYAGEDEIGEAIVNRLTAAIDQALLR